MVASSLRKENDRYDDIFSTTSKKNDRHFKARPQPDFVAQGGSSNKTVTKEEVLSLMSRSSLLQYGRASPTTCNKSLRPSTTIKSKSGQRDPPPPLQDPTTQSSTYKRSDSSQKKSERIKKLIQRSRRARIISTLAETGATNIGKSTAKVNVIDLTDVGTSKVERHGADIKHEQGSQAKSRKLNLNSNVVEAEEDQDKSQNIKRSKRKIVAAAAAVGIVGVCVGSALVLSDDKRKETTKAAMKLCLKEGKEVAKLCLKEGKEVAKVYLKEGKKSINQLICEATTMMMKVQSSPKTFIMASSS